MRLQRFAANQTASTATRRRHLSYWCPNTAQTCGRDSPVHRADHRGGVNARWAGITICRMHVYIMLRSMMADTASRPLEAKSTADNIQPPHARVGGANTLRFLVRRSSTANRRYSFAGSVCCLARQPQRHFKLQQAALRPMLSQLSMALRRKTDRTYRQTALFVWFFRLPPVWPTSRTSWNPYRPTHSNLPYCPKPLKPKSNPPARGESIGFRRRHSAKCRWRLSVLSFWTAIPFSPHFSTSCSRWCTTSLPAANRFRLIIVGIGYIDRQCAWFGTTCRLLRLAPLGDERQQFDRQTASQFYSTRKLTCLFAAPLQPRSTPQ